MAIIRWCLLCLQTLAFSANDVCLFLWNPTLGSALFWLYVLLVSTLPVPCHLWFPEHSTVPKHCLLKHPPASHSAIQRCSEKKLASVLQTGLAPVVLGTEDLRILTPANFDLIYMLESMTALHIHISHSPGLHSHKSKSEIDCSTKIFWIYYKMCAHNKFIKLENKSHGGHTTQAEQIFKSQPT